MGLFSKAAPLDPRFSLPVVKRMDCTQLNFPCKSEMAMTNFKWRGSPLIYSQEMRCYFVATPTVIEVCTRTITEAFTFKI